MINLTLIQIIISSLVVGVLLIAVPLLLVAAFSLIRDLVKDIKNEGWF